MGGAELAVAGALVGEVAVLERVVAAVAVSWLVGGARGVGSARQWGEGEGRVLAGW